MSAEPGSLAVDAVGACNGGPRTRLTHDVDRFFLEYQFATTKRHPDRLWRTKKGLDMGMKYSSELPDAAFAKLVETRCLFSLK